jgi:hypothetical protein
MLPIIKISFFKLPNINLLIIILLISLFLNAIFHNKKIFLISLTFIPFFVFILYIKNTYYIKLIKDIFLWLKPAFMNIKPSENLLFSTITVSFISFPFCIIGFIFSIKRPNPVFWLIVGMISYNILWYNNLFDSYLCLSVFLICIMIMYFREIYENMYYKSAVANIHLLKLTLFVLPIAIIFSVFISFLPYSESSLGEKQLVRVIDFISEYTIGSNLGFSLKSTDYYPDGRLGGDISSLDNSKVVMEVKSKHRLYLKGATFTNYNGTNWKNFNDTTMYDFCKDNNLVYKNINLPTETLVNNIPYEFLENTNTNYEINEAKIKYLNINTNTIFYSYKNDGILFDFDNDVTCNNFNLIMDKKEGTNFEYNIHYVHLNRNNSEFIDFINSNSTYNTKYGKILFAENTKIPSDIPIRVKTLSSFITKNCKTPYEKAIAIEKYLSTNYTYNLKPGSVDRNKDFVDHFLFESKEGYCTYFASAMTILLRISNVPCRYVEGYITPSNPDEDNTYKITEANAHAWVEVYFEDFGWLNFEPTATYNEILYDDSTNNIENDSDDNSQNTTTEAISDTPTDDTKTHPTEPDEKNTIENSNNSTNSKNNHSISKKSTIIIIILLLFIFIILGIYFINKFIYKKRQKKMTSMSHKNCIIFIYKRYLNIFTIISLNKNESEDLIEYSKRISPHLENYSKDFIIISKIFTKARYSNDKLNENDKNIVINFENSIQNIAKKRLGNFKYFIFKYIFAKL